MPIDAPAVPAPVLSFDAGEIIGRGRAMASDIAVRLPLGVESSRPALCAAVVSAFDLFAAVEAACTRFNPESPLMQVNDHPDRWHAVPPLLYRAIAEAHLAYGLTGGRFDPRVFTDLVNLGYDRSFAGEGSLGPARPGAREERPPWRPEFRSSSCEVCLGQWPIDLGGIGKGLAVRWAAADLRKVAPSFLIEAGGDCYAAGGAVGLDGWRIGVEDPFGNAEPLAVLEMRDRACTTSSIRVRHWRAAGRPVHHLIDPRTGQPGGAGLVAVSVVGADPAGDEVWSKSLFLSGVRHIASEAAERGIAALWVTADGALRTSPAIEPFVLWRRP